MSDEPTPELRALAAQLFAAGRAERPGRALGRRLLLIEPPASGEPRAPASGDVPRAANSLSRGRGVRALFTGVAAAAVAAGSVGLWWSLGQGPVIDMSPDPVSVRARPVRVAPPRHVQPAPPSPEALGAVSPTAPMPVAGDAERVQGLTERSARATVRSAVPRRPPSKQDARERARAQRPRAPAGAEERGAALQAAQVAPTTRAPADAPAAPAAVAPAAVALGLSQELALLKEARFALRAGEAKHALDVLDQHARARAADGLHAEATLLRVEALDALGQRAEAAELAARFVRENPFSALADRARTFIRASAAVR